MLLFLSRTHVTYAFSAVSPLDGAFDSLVLPHVNSDCMQICINEMASRYSSDHIVMIVDGAGSHKSKDIHLPEIHLLFLHRIPLN
ncbi:hypothetical protein [Nitrosomonas communis]|uniref:hypothetical protein n=1 Tax=Nitrosomonas communis TaxID=44574 RepID=UPI001160AA7E|nr:hypothetical protein [Nitrosomonas communis]